MTVIQKTIGRLPVNLGDYDTTRAYGKKNRVLLYGCEWESKVNNNTYAPAALNTTTGVITPDTTHWKLISGSYNTWLIDNGYKKADANNVKDGDLTQHEINEAVSEEIGEDTTPASIKGRIKTLETNVGEGGSVDERIAAEGAEHYLKSETYTKSEVNGMITTPDQEYVTVTATDQTTSVTDVLPATGEPDTVYRVGNWDGNQYDATAYSEYAWNESTSQYIHLSTKPQIGEVFDISAYHATGGTLATYSDLNDAINGVNGGVPQSLQKGGMSVKFVQSSDNKYVQFRCKTQAFSADTEDWVFEGDDTLVENPEYIKVITDGAGHLLCWIRKSDGGIDWAVGVPEPVKDYVATEIAKILNGSTSTDIDGINKIIAFLDDFSTSDTLANLLATKVDKEEGKSLIPTQFIQEIENPEFIKVETDNEDKFLEGIRKDGTKVFGSNVEAEKFSASEIELDGNLLSPIATTAVSSVIEDPEERLEIKTDNEEKLISYRKKDGILVEEVGIETNALRLTEQGMTEFQQALKNAGFRPGGAGDFTDSDSMYVAEPRIARLNIISNVNLSTLVKEGYWDAEKGVNYDVPCQVEYFDSNNNYFKKFILLSGQGRSSLQFKKRGLGMDFFNEDPSAQDFDEDNVFTMKFGSWVPQDSFHIKSFYTDFPRCTTPVVYKIAEEVAETRGIMADRPYKKYYVDEYSDGDDGTSGLSDIENNIETGARCISDGFPVIVYQNGVFWGVNSWQLKKHRDNYQLSKKKATQIHLDGGMGTAPGIDTPFWLWNGTINWTAFLNKTYGIEVRTPKNLYCIDGKKYNADSHNVELITTATAEEWIAAGVITPTGKTIDDELAGYLRTTGKVRENIEVLTTYIPSIRQLATVSTNNGNIKINGYGGAYSFEKNFAKGIYVLEGGRYYMSLHTSNTGNPVSDANNWIDVTNKVAEVREVLSDKFDVNTFIDYIVIGNVIGNTDAWDNNGQIITWGKLGSSDNLNYSVNVWDCDVSFGCPFDATVANPADDTRYGLNYPVYKEFWDFFFDEIRERYIELRNMGIFDANHIISLFRDWMNRVGYDNYVKEYKKWPDSPCFRDSTITYPDNPTTGGFYGSIYRIYLWIKKRIEYMDDASFFNYNRN